MIRVGVHGAAGRMGLAACAAIAADDRLQLVATAGRGDPIKTFVTAGCDVVVDFTVAEAARTAVPWLLRQGIHVVTGTTGLTAADLDEVRDAAARGQVNAVVAANFAISAVLMMRMAEMAAPFFDTVEVIELHHDGKVDAPSGTALATAERIAAAKGEWAPDPTTREELVGARGAVGPAGIRIHSVRMRGMVAHQEVILGATGQTLTIRQDSYRTDSFMPGVLLACTRVGSTPGVTVGLDPLLD